MHEAKTHFSKLVARAAAGEEIVLASGGKPQARLVPIASGCHARKAGWAKGKVRIAADFDGPVPGFEEFY